jgi:hypothetical protein
VTWCNAYGAENPGGQAVPFGGFLPNPVSVQPVCDRPAVHRFRWVCEHGHQGPIVSLCDQHHAEFTGRAEVPVNLRRDVQSCPRCAAGAPDCTDPDHMAMYRGRPGACGCQQHKCQVRLVTVS